jgi:hypothetical protein
LELSELHAFAGQQLVERVGSLAQHGDRLGRIHQQVCTWIAARNFRRCGTIRPSQTRCRAPSKVSGAQAMTRPSGMVHR